MSLMHDLRLGDCLDPVTGLASLPDKSVDHVITDPPYEAEAHTLQRRLQRGSRRRYERGGPDTTRVEPIDFAPMDEDARRNMAAELVRLVRGWAIVFCQAEAVGAWRDALVAAGAAWRRPMIWVKTDPQPNLCGDRPAMGYESMATAWCGGSRSRWNGGGKPGIYITAKVTGYQKNATWGIRNEHPTQKPLALMEALVRDFSDPGELILDPFAGSGTTGVACRRLGRGFIGWERDPKYHAIAVKRIAAAREQLEFAPRGPKPKQAVFNPLTGEGWCR